MKAGDNKEFWQRRGCWPWRDSMSIPNGHWEDLNGSFRSIIFKSHKQPRLAEALRRCAIWRRVFRNDKECDP